MDALSKTSRESFLNTVVAVWKVWSSSGRLCVIVLNVSEAFCEFIIC